LPNLKNWSKKKVLDKAQDAPDTVFLAEDEASLYLQATTMAVWALRGQTPVLRSDTQRDKVNFYGTLDLHTGQEIVLRTTEMNAQVSIQHLEQLLAAYPNRPIVLFWDRASWHKGPLVGDFLAANPRLEIMYFPVGAPDLNPQEHVWKATRRVVSHNHLTPKLPQLADQFEAHLGQSTFQSSFLHRYGYGTVVCPNFI
jgi:transposase